MADVIAMDSLQAYQLKECYELAAQLENLDIAKEVLKEKSRRLDIPMNYAPVQTDAAYTETDMQIVSEAMYGLTLEGFSASEKVGFKYAHKINDLPSSAEKEFVLALISLRNGSSETQRLDALRHINVALSFSPNDPRFIALAQVLQEAESK